ncbi:MAG: 4a-hydroxytetrahydrobiopterin dehydratase [Candidatus Omnitrophica bacterium]|nr:4a-hydroxytetrahydrobiopterin dehydratase [Candidatus Omnitrophota bacterium]
MNQFAQIAEVENHNSDINWTDYRKLRVELKIHDVGGLSEKDFIEAIKNNRLPVELKH